MAMRGEVPEGGNEEPQFHRDIFEANAFAFFRCLHAVIDSVPYILNLILGDLDRAVSYTHLTLPTIYSV